MYLESDNDQWYHEIIYIRSFYAVLQSTIFWGILLRNIRIFIVFETKLDNKIIKFFFASDWGLISILVFKIFVETIVISSLQNNYSLEIAYFDTNSYDKNDIESLFFHHYWMIKHCF